MTSGIPTHGRWTNARTEEDRTMSEARDHFVKVYETDDLETKRKVWKAEPGELKARPGDTVTWRPEETDITLNFPDRQVFLPQRLEVNNYQQRSLTIRHDATGGPHPYAVFCHSGKVYAQGSAHPVIIIERG